MNQSPFLTERLANVRTRPRFDMTKWHDLEPDFWFDCSRFLNHLRRQNYVIDCITYSYQSQGLPIRRLVTGLLAFPSAAVQHHRHIEGIHCKLYLCYVKNSRGLKLSDAFVGSWNLVLPTTLNLMTRVADKKTRLALLDYFEIVWNHETDPTPKCTTPKLNSPP